MSEGTNGLRGPFYATTILTLLAGAGLLLGLHQQGPLIIPGALKHTVWIVMASFLVWGLSRLRGDTVPRRSRGAAARWWLVAILFFYLVSSATQAKWFYLLDWWNRRDPHAIPFLSLWAMAGAALTFLVAWKKRSLRWLLPLVLVGGAAFCFITLLKTTDGWALYRDDHPSFMHRIHLILQTFPQMRNYIPAWNAGSVDIAWLTSGTHGFALPWWPVFANIPIEQAYTPVVGLTYIVVIPLIAVAAARGLGVPWSYATIAGCLSMGVSQHFFLWLLNYGTIGASLTMSFVAPVSALVLRAIWLRRPTLGLGVALVVAVSFLLTWQPGTLMLMAMVPGALLCWKRLDARKIWFFTVCGLLAILIFLPTALTLMFGESVTNFALSGGGKKAGASELLMAGHFWIEGAKHLAAHMVEMHPVLLVFGLVGLFGGAPRPVRMFYAPLCLILAFLCGWGPALKPNLQLSRMGIPLAFALVIPATLTMYRFLREERLSRSAVRAGLVVLLAFGMWSVGRTYGNESKFHYETMEGAQRIIRWIKDAQPTGGRVLFAGSTVHGIHDGHVAFLPHLTGREMMGVDYYHFPPEMVVYEYPPMEFWTDEETMIRFMDLHDVSHVITIRDHWKGFLAKRTDHFEMIHHEDGIAMFRMKREPNRWLKGSGTIEARPNVIDVTPDDPTSDVVIRYTWDPRLQVAAPAEIFPANVVKGVTFVGLRPNGVKSIRVQFKP